MPLNGDQTTTPTPYKFTPLKSVTVIAPSVMVTSRDQRDYGHATPLPFQLLDERQDFGSMQIEVSFPENLASSLMEQVEIEAFGTWFSAANAGVFCEPNFPIDDCRLYLGDPRSADDYMILSLDTIVLPEPTAINSLLNTFVWAHDHITPISRIELYD